MTEQGNTIDVALLRGCLKRALEDEAIADAVNDLLFEHVIAGRYHPSVIAESLPSYIAEILNAAKLDRLALGGIPGRSYHRCPATTAVEERLGAGPHPPLALIELPHHGPVPIADCAHDRDGIDGERTL